MQRKCGKAFGLIEVSYLLLIFGILSFITLLLQNHRSSNVVKDYYQTERKLNEIERALIIFVAQNGRLPCPGSIVIDVQDSSFGIERIGPEQGRATTCTLGGPGGISAYSLNQIHTLFQGAVPTRTLGLSDEYMFDSWDNKIEYAVVMPFAYPKPEEASYFTARDINGNTLSNLVSYFLVSHGKNGLTGYSRFGSTVNSSSNNLENMNSLDYANGSIRISAEITTAHHSFDDITRYKEQQQIIDECNLLAQNICDEMFEEEEGGNGEGDGGNECDAPDAGPECD